MRWFARLVACLLALLTGNATPASAASAATTTTASVTFAYDGATAARVDVGESEAAAATPTLLRGSRGGSASPLTSIPRTSTTPSTRSVATNTAGGSLDNAAVYRYVSEGEANVARSMGRVPNTDVLGQPRSVFYSPDYVDSVAEAERSLQIGAMNPGGATASPGFRITASPQGAQWTYGGNVAGWSGIEMLTDQALKVLRIDRLPR
jgi:hypothetical protein